MIILTAAETYTATIEGVGWSNITPASRLWYDVQAMIESGAEVVDMTAPEPEPVPTTPEESLTTWRAQAYLEKGAFVIALLDAKILPEAEAVQASKGDWPQTFADALAAVGVEPIRAQVAWGAATGVARQNPLFLAVLGFYSHVNSMTPEQAVALGDRIFGWVE